MLSIYCLLFGIDPLQSLWVMSLDSGIINPVGKLNCKNIFILVILMIILFEFLSVILLLLLPVLFFYGF